MKNDIDFNQPWYIKNNIVFNSVDKIKDKNIKPQLLIVEYAKIFCIKFTNRFKKDFSILNN